MSKRVLLSKSNGIIRVVAISDFANMRSFIRNEPNVEYFSIDPIHLARTPKLVKEMSPKALKQAFEYNLAKGRFLRFNGHGFTFIIPNH